MAFTPIKDMATAVGQRLFPAITMLNRVEGRPRTRQFGRALKAEVRDALWLLTRQWQTGELDGDDAGSPFFAELRLETAPLTKYRAGTQPGEPFNADLPLEATVERRPLPLSLDLRVLLGRQWLKLVAAVPGAAALFLAGYPIAQPAADDASVQAHPEVAQALAAYAGRRLDGGKLYLHLTAKPDNKAYDGLEVSEVDKPALDEAAERFLASVGRLFVQPDPAENSGWNPSRLEYRFACSAAARAGEKVLTAEEYYHGRLDWYNLTGDSAAPPLTPDPVAPPDPKTMTTVPVPVQFAGMPHTRWWEFEDGQTNLGDVTASTTDLAKLLFLEFGLVYANDWFVIPCTLPSGSVTQVRGLVVTNVFGERIWVEAAGQGVDNAWQRWGLFQVSRSGGGAVDNSLLLLPTLPQLQESQPVEEVVLFRDEASNLVWGIEKTVRLADGTSKSGSAAAAETRAFFAARVQDQPAAPEPPLPDAVVRYRAMTTVPENWIPFIPVHRAGENRAIQLQRSALTRVIDGDDQPARPIEPRTTLLREGLEEKRSYFLHEEEVPRAGVRLTQTYQRARWRNGRVVLWLGLRKQVGRGEGSSGLAFDQIRELPPPG